jgi:chromosome segregation ATPase
VENTTAILTRTGESMAELPATDIPSIVQGALKVIAQVSAFVNAMKDLTEQNEELQARVEGLERERDELREREAAVRREGEETAEVLAELRGAYEALLVEHENCGRTLLRLREERTVLFEGRRRAPEELGAVMSPLKSTQPAAPAEV